MIASGAMRISAPKENGTGQKLRDYQYGQKLVRVMPLKKLKGVKFIKFTGNQTARDLT